MKKRAVILFLSILFPATLLGCRESPVLEAIVYQQNQETDPNQKSLDSNPEHPEQDQQLPPQEQTEDARTQNDPQQNMGRSGQTTSADTESWQSTYQEQANANGQTSISSGNTTNQGETGRPADSADGMQQPSDAAGSNESQSGGSDASGMDGSQGTTGDISGNGSGEGEQPGTDETHKQIVDARGTVIDLPEQVDTVTAVGEAATMVEMLGGPGRLLGSSEQFLKNQLAGNAFPDLSSVQTWWQNDGSGAISDAAFSALLEAAPQVCFEISGQGTFTEKQVAALSEHGITYVVLPAMNSIENIKTAVSLVGEVLGDKSSDNGTNAVKIAQEYTKWADEMLSKINGSGQKKSTLYVTAWDENAYWEIKNSEQGVWKSGYGAAVAEKNNATAMNDCLTQANLSNAGSDRVYVNPLKNNYWLHYIQGGNGIFRYGMNLTVSQGDICLGNDAFPAVIVSSADIKTHMQADLHWNVYSWVSDAAGNMGRGLSDGQGHIIPSTIEKSYEIYVNPSGLGSWSGGSVETPLEVAWLSCKFQGGCSLEEVRSMVSDFYSHFYHMDQVNTQLILGE